MFTRDYWRLQEMSQEESLQALAAEAFIHRVRARWHARTHARPFACAHRDKHGSQARLKEEIARDDWTLDLD